MKQCLRTFWLCLLALLGSWQVAHAEDTFYLKENMQRAKPGDYIVTSANKTFTVLHINDKQNNVLFLEEITVPEARMKSGKSDWKTWIEQNAPFNTSWVMYEINLESGQMNSFFSFTKNGWYNIAQSDNFLSTLLNLKMNTIPENDRRKVGPGPDLFGPDHRKLWQPKMIVDGKEVNGVKFDAWRTRWPKDGSELSNLLIEIYVPAPNEKYPSYFPFWLQISGFVGKAKIHIVDSGTGLKSPKPSLNSLKAL